MEEIELYYHPELQRQFIKYLLDGLMQMRFSDIKAISVMIVTHSPFVLSDIPTQNVLPLRNGKPAVRELLSFGANIHDLLDSNFLMEKGSKGLFAEWVIKEVVKALAIYEKGNTERSHDENVFIQNYPKQTLHKLIMTIDEPIVRSLIMKRYHEVFEQLNDDEEIRELEARLNELKSRRNRHVASGETK